VPGAIRSSARLLRSASSSCPQATRTLIQRWVQTTGTVYAFSPSISALKALDTE
jgi:hypothetical protein